MKAAVIWIVFALLILTQAHQCQHDHFSRNTTKHYLNDLTDRRLLQGGESGRLRIFVDYSQVTVGGDTQINTIKRIMNISASYFYNVLNVTRLPRLFYPSNIPLQCNALKVPGKYATQGAIGDLGVICGNQKRDQVVYIAKSTPCAFLQSSKRPIWGIIIFNNVYLKFDQQGFQQILFVGMHQMTHILGFSASMFASYPKGNPLVTTPDGSNFLNSPRIQQEIRNHFGCQNAKGLPLQDQDGTLIASHWQKKVVGNEFMIASNKKSSFVSRFTLALLQSSGFYTDVSYQYAQPTIWGRNKSCGFLNIDNCNSEQFCSVNPDGVTPFSCDSDATGMGRCNVDPYTGTCLVIKYFTNTICIDESFQIKNLNARLNTLERGGSSSRCFNSDFRQPGIDPTALNNRCYVNVCSASGKFLYILVGNFVVVCRSQGQVIRAPVGLEGTLTCPRNFGVYCQNKKTCPYHCNKNGACINGKCLCTGVTSLTQSCIDVSILKAPIGLTGGLTASLTDQAILLTDLNSIPSSSTIVIQRDVVKKYSIDRKCIQGTTFDKIFGECLQCSEVFNCANCDQDGCISCDNGRQPSRGRC